MEKLILEGREAESSAGAQAAFAAAGGYGAGGGGTAFSSHSSTPHIHFTNLNRGIALSLLRLS